MRDPCKVYLELDRTSTSAYSDATEYNLIAASRLFIPLPLSILDNLDLFFPYEHNEHPVFQRSSSVCWIIFPPLPPSQHLHALDVLLMSILMFQTDEINIFLPLSKSEIIGATVKL